MKSRPKETRIIPEISVHIVDGLSVVVVFISEAFCRDKPVYIKSDGERRGAFRRIGSSDIRCMEEDLDLLYLLRHQRNYESEILPGASWEDISEESIVEYRRIRYQVEPDASELSLDDQSLLLSLRMAVKENGQVIPTIGGLLFFGNKEALRREFPMASRVDYIVIDGTTWVGDPLARYEFAVEYREGLMTMMPRLQAQIMSDIPSKFQLESGKLERNDTPLIPREVVREALANALIHRDYRSHQPTQIIRYSNRLEFRNSGYSLKSMEELGEPGSRPRNPTISSLFHDLNRAETKGTGIGTMVEKMRAAGLTTPPIFESDRNRNAFDLILLPHHLLDQEMLEWLSLFKGMELSDAKRRALAFTKNIGAITNQDYRQLNGTDTLNASAALRNLRDIMLLEQKGKGSDTYYVLGTKADYNPTPHTSVLSEGLCEQESLLLPDELRKGLSSLSSRSKPSDIEEIIKNLCALQPLQVSLMAKLLGRSSRYLRDRYLSKMVKKRELEYLYPDQPGHPQQAYSLPKARVIGDRSSEFIEGEGTI